MRNLPVNYNPPRHPVSYRAPVPQGLIESIGHSVQHADTFGVKLQQQSSVYLPPGAGEIPRPQNSIQLLPQQNHVEFNNQGLHTPSSIQSLPLQNHVDFNGNNQGLHTHIQQQALPYSNSARFVGSDCSQGPNLASSNIPVLRSTYGVPNVALDVSQSSFETAHSSANEPTSSYGPPPSGNPADSVAFATELKPSADTPDTSDDNVQLTQSEETNASSLPGLSGAGLDIVSAKQSHSLEIPVQGALGSYSLQFQSADPLGIQNNEVDTPNHKQLLSEGLLQSILSAIEQPNGKTTFVAPQTDIESLENHKDVEQFIQSQVGQETLSDSEPKTE